MEVDFQKVNVEQLSITFQNDLINNSFELKTFGNIIKKIYKESNKAGFKKMFNAEEKAMIDELYEEFVADNTQNVNNIGSGLTYVPEEE